MVGDWAVYIVAPTECSADSAGKVEGSFGFCKAKTR